MKYEKIYHYNMEGQKYIFCCNISYSIIIINEHCLYSTFSFVGNKFYDIYVILMF